MPRPVSIPKITLHKASGKAVVRLNGRDHYLGAFGTPETTQAYNQLIAEWLARNRQPLSIPGENSQARALSVNEVLLAFWRHAEQHYRDADGKPSSEITSLRKALRQVREIYGLIPVTSFGPLALKAVRKAMIESGLCRGVINRSIDRVKRVFKWAASEELISVSIFEALRTVTGLRAGRTEAHDWEPVKPVELAHVTATLPHLNRHLRAMVELQQLTGMRPGEVCKLSIGEIDRTGETWLYRLSRHKAAHHGKERVVPLGPRACEVITAFLKGHNPPPAGFEGIKITDQTVRRHAADAYQKAGRDKDAHLLRSEVSISFVSGCVVDPLTPLFSPKEARVERYRTLRENRKSKVPPSQMNRKVKNPKRPPRSQFDTVSYGHAVARAAEIAGVPHWHPHQLRHTFATEVRRLHGLEAAQVLLGHSRADVTQVYAERNLTLAARIAREIG